MAESNKMTMLVDLYKNNNSTSKNYGQYYGRIFRRKGLNLKGFAKHISEHGSLVKYDLAVLVLQNIVSCLREMMVQGIPVKLDGLGTFSPGITGVGANSIDAYDCDVNIKGVVINFQPESAGYDEDKLTKKQLKSETTFELNDYVIVHYKTVDGQTVSSCFPRWVTHVFCPHPGTASLHSSDCSSSMPRYALLTCLERGSA